MSCSTSVERFNYSRFRCKSHTNLEATTRQFGRSKLWLQRKSPFTSGRDANLYSEYIQRQTVSMQLRHLIILQSVLISCEFSYGHTSWSVKLYFVLEVDTPGWFVCLAHLPWSIAERCGAWSETTTRRSGEVDDDDSGEQKQQQQIKFPNNLVLQELLYLLSKQQTLSTSIVQGPTFTFCSSGYSAGSPAETAPLTAKHLASYACCCPTKNGRGPYHP